MTIVNKPDMSYGVWAEGGNIEIPSSEKVEEGWVIEKPLNEWMNWLQNRQDKMLAYLNQRGIGEWDIRTEYPANGLVARGGTIYQATSQNTDKDPTLHQNIWKIAFVSYADFVDYSDKIDKIENQDGYLNHYVRRSTPILDSPCRGIEYNNMSNSSGFRFSQNIPLVSNSGITVAEFSGGTNPKDVVTHEQLALAIQSYKIGDIYITTTVGDPSLKLGYGTWERFGKGRTLVGFTDEFSNNIPEWVKAGGREFGSYEHKLTVAEMPSHTHDIKINADNTNGNYPEDASGAAQFYTAKTEPTGGDKPHNNVQPSIVVYFWKRIS